MSTFSSDTPLPDWALREASAGLKIGLTVPQIEELLAAKGLSPATAKAVVNAVLEGSLRAASNAPGIGEKALWAHRAASRAVIGLSLGLAYQYGGGLSIGKTLLWLLGPTFCIWFAEVISSGVPPAFIRWAAWAAVVAILGYRVVLLALQSSM